MTWHHFIEQHPFQPQQPFHHTYQFFYLDTSHELELPVKRNKLGWCTVENK